MEKLAFKFYKYENNLNIRYKNSEMKLNENSDNVNEKELKNSADDIGFSFSKKLFEEYNYNSQMSNSIDGKKNFFFDSSEDYITTDDYYQRAIYFKLNEIKYFKDNDLAAELKDLPIHFLETNKKLSLDVKFKFIEENLFFSYEFKNFLIDIKDLSLIVNREFFKQKQKGNIPLEELTPEGSNLDVEKNRNNLNRSNKKEFLNEENISIDEIRGNDRKIISNVSLNNIFDENTNKFNFENSKENDNIKIVIEDLKYKDNNEDLFEEDKNEFIKDPKSILVGRAKKKFLANTTFDKINNYREDRNGLKDKNNNFNNYFPNSFLENIQNDQTDKMDVEKEFNYNFQKIEKDSNFLDKEYFNKTIVLNNKNNIQDYHKFEKGKSIYKSENKDVNIYLNRDLKELKNTGQNMSLNSKNKNHDSIKLINVKTNSLDENVKNVNLLEDVNNSQRDDLMVNIENFIPSTKNYKEKNYKKRIDAETDLDIESEIKIDINKIENHDLNFEKTEFECKKRTYTETINNSNKIQLINELKNYKNDVIKELYGNFNNLGIFKTNKLVINLQDTEDLEFRKYERLFQDKNDFKKILSKDEIKFNLKIHIWSKKHNDFITFSKKKIELKKGYEEAIDLGKYEDIIFENNNYFFLQIIISSSKKLKIGNKEYCGIKNENNTCYLNSIFQIFFNLNILRKTIFNILSNEGTSTFFVQQAFFEMQKKLKKDISIINYIENELLDVKIQNDLTEFLFLIFHVLLEEEKNFNGQSQLENYCMGAYCTNITCPSINFHSKKTETFLLLQLDMTNCNDLLQCLEKFLSVENMTDENKYELEDKTKHDAIRSILFERLPPILFINLKRFEFQDKLIKKFEKINYDEFLDFENYISKEKFSENSSNKHDEKDVKKNFIYELYGVVVHEGDSNTGHYYVFFKENKTKNWIKFNDNLTTYATEYEVFERNFGGFNKNINIDLGEMFQEYYGTGRTAYILIYLQIDEIKEILKEVNQSDVIIFNY